jgi:alanine-glyoxylate transaminase/serine-glyoxylate transaminase/serine-pyruvate transaminase
MDLAAANLVEPDDKALVVNTGYFSDRMGDILERYGATVDHVRATIGDLPRLDAVEAALKRGGYKVMAFTHVDTSTAVVADARALGALGLEYGALTVLDGVCSVAGEELRQEEWGVDVAFTASQKAVGVPPGLALLVAGPRAMDAFTERRAPVGNYYADWTNWLPIMEAYEQRRPSYFGTPAVNLVWALNVSLGQILEEGMDARFQRHRRLNRAFKAAIVALGMDQVPVRPELAASTLTAPYYPDGVDKALLGHIKEAGVIVAGGLHAEIRDRYFRVGHMGAVNESDILATVGAIEKALARAGYRFDLGAGLAATQSMLVA